MDISRVAKRATAPVFSEMRPPRNQELGWKIQAEKEFLKPRVDTQRVKQRIDLQNQQKIGPFLVGGVQPRHGLIVIAKTNVHQDEANGGYSFSFESSVSSRRALIAPARSFARPFALPIDARAKDPSPESCPNSSNSLIAMGYMPFAA